MKRPPRDNSSNILSDGVWFKIVYQAAIQIILVMVMYVVAIKVYDNIVANTMIFFMINFIQLFHSVNLKTSHSITTINIFKNKVFNFSFLAGVLLIGLVAFVPFLNTIFRITRLNFVQWSIVMLCSISIIPLVELAKWIVGKIKIERIR